MHEDRNAAHKEMTGSQIMSFTDGQSRPTESRGPDVRITNLDEEDLNTQGQRLEQDEAPELEHITQSDE